MPSAGVACRLRSRIHRHKGSGLARRGTWDEAHRTWHKARRARGTKAPHVAQGTRQRGTRPRAAARRRVQPVRVECRLKSWVVKQPYGDCRPRVGHTSRPRHRDRAALAGRDAWRRAGVRAPGHPVHGHHVAALDAVRILDVHVRNRREDGALELRKRLGRARDAVGAVRYPCLAPPARRSPRHGCRCPHRAEPMAGDIARGLSSGTSSGNADCARQRRDAARDPWGGALIQWACPSRRDSLARRQGTIAKPSAAAESAEAVVEV